ncbi:hypothetical protein BV22DRAFT_440955 [Leucogyrophana mollusca]|uniref:Uncharacterized protein n=1 Tax=Leucogyrophana mollusca TaxID=85980 RepID=A0ACB8BJJ8_9AGAM|nr:hypothetical protein BV22DRAFT_440955 [Leucogyrophana mollusca]
MTGVKLPKKWNGKEPRPLETVLTQRDIQSSDIIIPVMGPSGVGKSTFINTLVGTSQAKVGHNLECCTVNTQDFIVTHPKDPDRRIILVDTPSFGNASVNDVEVLGRICGWLVHLYGNNSQISGFIYLHPISQTRMVGPSATKDFTIFKKLCGDDAYPNVILATTKWSDVKEDMAKRREEQLSSFWKDMVDNGSRMAQFRGTSDSAWAIVNLILERQPLQSLQIQRELVDSQKSIPDTQAGGCLRDMLKDLVSLQKKNIARLRKEGGDELEQTLEDAEEQLRSASSQLDQLKKVRLVRRVMSFVGLHRLSASRPTTPAP